MTIVCRFNICATNEYWLAYNLVARSERGLYGDTQCERETCDTLTHVREPTTLATVPYSTLVHSSHFRITRSPPLAVRLTPRELG